MATYTLDQLARMIDHTNLKADALTDDIKVLCVEAQKYHFASACFNQVQSPVAANCLKGTDIKACAVISFPLGQTSIESKVFETENALQNGANEIDYVINIGEARAGNWDYLKREMEAIVVICNKYQVISKVIFETCYLTEDQKIKLCEIASIVKPSFVKTSTGTTSSGATVEDVALMNRLTPDDVQVKASGGVRTAAQFLDMLKHGATRVGASAGIAIIEELKEKYFANGEEFLRVNQETIERGVR
ncbi:MAG: deoxyribose-phosphate aldolase [Defluviitaleaceae bacterium]|nr:deoxyribose-phosphate aldolase [Defluviitaleaceae bacterium]